MVYKNCNKKLKELRETAIEETLKIASVLKKSGVDLSKIQYSYIKNGKKHFITLKEIKQEGIDIKTIIKENDLNGDFKYGMRLNGLKKAYKGKGHLAITKLDKELAKKLGMIKEESTLGEYLKIAQILKNAGVDISKVPARQNKNGRQYYILLKEIEQEGIDINKIIEKNELDENYEYGMRLHMLRQAYKGKGTYVITEGEKKLAGELRLVKNKLSSKEAEKQQAIQEKHQAHKLCELYEKALEKQGKDVGIGNE